MPAGDSSPVPDAPATSPADCGAPVQGQCRTSGNPCRKHALRAAFQDARQRAVKAPASAAAAGVAGLALNPGPSLHIESPKSKPSKEAPLPAQFLSTEVVSRPRPAPDPAQQPPRPRALEFCAGSVGLTRALAAAGFDAVGVDWSRNRHKAKAPIVRLDLSPPRRTGGRVLDDARSTCGLCTLCPPLRHIHPCPRQTHAAAPG